MYVHCTYYISICWRRWIFYKSGGAHSRPSPLARTQYTSKQVRYFFIFRKKWPGMSSIVIPLFPLYRKKILKLPLEEEKSGKS